MVSGSHLRRAWLPVALALVVLLMTGCAATPQGQAPASAPIAAQAGAALPREISLEQAVARRDAGAFILDVRQPEEWAEYHVPDSTLIPLGELEQRLSEVPKDREVVVVCRSGNRSASGRDILLKAGYPQVTSLAGGLSQWKAKGYPTVSGE